MNRRGNCTGGMKAKTVFGAHEKDSTLLAHYLGLINETLPATFTHPVRFNHCFARIVLDWLFADCWYNHLHGQKPAYRQLTNAQLQAAVDRMKAWLQNPPLLLADNKASLAYRSRNKKP